MCFSATASFGAGIVLTTIGVATLKKVQTPNQIAFASIPLIFAIQQISEGFVWLSLSNPEFGHMERSMTYLFLFFAQVVWPFWVPFSIMKIESIKKQKKRLIPIVLIGGVVSLYLFYCLLSFHVDSKIVGYHISYEQSYPLALSLYGGGLYLIATIAPPFFSSIKKMSLLGSGILISYIITQIFYEDYIVSVWCFFESVISITVYGIVWLMQRSATNQAQLTTN